MSNAKPHLMVMAGGTGGHVFPALAVAHALREQGIDITWLGTKRGLEAKVVPANNIDIEWITIEGLRGKGVTDLILAPFNLMRAMWQSARVIRKVKPDCILGMGGFVAGPGGLVAKLLGCKLVVHEQNAVAGLTNKYLAKIADRALTGFPQVTGMPKRAKWIGNPVRDSISMVGQTVKNQAEPIDSTINILIVGGSQGAHSFNKKLPAMLSELVNTQISVWHQSGRKRAKSVMNAYKRVGMSAKVTEFIDDMATAYQWADLLICRAGAMTIAECCAAGKPALLIPYPFSAGDHQIKNAEVMVNVGAAKMLMNEQIDDVVLLETLAGLLSNKQRLVDMGKQARTLYKPDALQHVVHVCKGYLNA